MLHVHIIPTAARLPYFRPLAPAYMSMHLSFLKKNLHGHDVRTQEGVMALGRLSQKGR